MVGKRDDGWDYVIIGGVVGVFGLLVVAVVDFVEFGSMQCGS